MRKARASKNPEWPKKFAQLEELVIAGEHRQGWEILDSFEPQRIPRTWALRFAEVAFRVHSPLTALKILHRFIYPENHFTGSASPQEKLVYACALSGLGAARESEQIFDSLSDIEEPEVLYFTAMANCYNWKYLESIPLLQKYIQSAQISPYRKVVSQVNLAAAFIFSFDWISANELLADVKIECESQNYKLLLGNCYELMAQVHLFQGQYDEALDLLALAKQHLQDHGGIYSMYIDKWVMVAQCLKTRDPKDIELLLKLRDNAATIGHFETVRECDLFAAIASQDQDLFKKVILGTPSEIYRQRARKLFGQDLSYRGKYRWNLNSQSAGPLFDPYIKSSSSEGLFERPALLSLFEALCDDFYKPSNIGLLFQKIYPDEIFNPFSSPPRVLQGLRRLNKWLTENSWPIRVEFKKSEFKLYSVGPVQIALERGKKSEASDGLLNFIKNHFSDKMFTAADVAEQLTVSRTKAQRTLLKLTLQGKLSRTGRGKSIGYQIRSRTRKDSAA